MSILGDHMTPAQRKWVLQDVADVYKQFPSWFPKLSNAVTDTYGRIKRFLGYGRLIPGRRSKMERK